MGLYAQRSATDDIIRFYQWKISRDPDDFFNYDKLGTAYIRKARETGDIRYYDLAEKAVDRSLELESTHREAVSATLHLASVYFAEHKFKQALEYAQKSLSFGTGDLSPYAVLGDALVEIGEYDEAAAAYSKLDDDGQSIVPHQGLAYLAETRKANLEFLKGDVPGSIELMRKAVEGAIRSQMPKESVAWTQFMLGEELLQSGDLKNAAAAAQDALTTYPDYHLALAGLAKVRAAQGRLGDSADLYKRAMAIVPMPAYAAGLGDVYTKLGLPAEANKQYDLVEFIAHLNALSKTVYNRELAMFYADHSVKLGEALELAQRELEVRHDIYTWDCVAWALHKNGRNAEAADAISKALAQGTKDALLYFHAGMIYFALDDESKARDYLASVMAINPRFHVLYADMAERKLRQIEQHLTPAGARDSAITRNHHNAR